MDDPTEPDLAGVFEGRKRQPPYSLKMMLRVHLMQNWFGLSDPALEEALYEIARMCQFAGLR